MIGSRSRWACRSKVSPNVGINVFRRLPQTLSAASHNTVNTWRTASSYSRLHSRVAFVAAEAPLLPQQLDGVLAVIPSQGRELIENRDLFTERRAAIPHSQRFEQLLAYRHADLPRHVALLPPDNPTGSKLREATGQHGLQF